MINQSIDVIATILVLVAPFALALFVVVLVAAYPWLLLIAFGFWYLVVTYVPDGVATGDEMTDG
jgi:hypothetical protein